MITIEELRTAASAQHHRSAMDEKMDYLMEQVREMDLEDEKGKYIYKSELKSRYHLTDSWIKKLGAADKTIPNQYYTGGARHQLFLVQRVEQFIEENKAGLKKLLSKAKEREQAKRDEFKEANAFVMSAQIEFNEVPNVCELEGYDGVGALDMIREEHTNYSALRNKLHKLYPVAAKVLAYDLLDRVNSAICDEIEMLCDVV